VHPARSIAVSDEKVSIGEKCHIGGAVLRSVAIEFWLCGNTAGPNLFTCQSCFHHAPSTCIAVIKKLLTTFSAEVESVGTTAKLRSKTADELSLLIEDSDGICLLRVFSDGMGDVDVAGRILG